MKHLLILPALLLTLLLGNPAFSADFEKGESAYLDENYATALRELTPFAENKGLSSYLYSKDNVRNAQRILGEMYFEGLGVPRNDKTAAKWFRLAAKQGDAFAQYSLGLMYRKGWGVPQDYKTAVKWHRLGAEQGDAGNQQYLGKMYGMGRGVIQDYVRAHMWFNIAASSGNKGAVKDRDIVAKRMTSSQLEKAAELARECVRKKYKGC